MQQALHFHAFDDLHAAPPRGTRETGGGEVGVGKTGLGLEADQRRVVEAGDRQQAGGLRGIQFLHADALGALPGQRAAQRIELGALGRGDQVAALDQPGRSASSSSR
jgi:hypothetical protein